LVKNYRDSVKIIKLLRYYLCFYFNKISFLKNKKYILYKNYAILIVNISKQKPFINLILDDKIIITLSPGIIKKKLEIKEKSIKKSQKMFKLMLKILAFNVKKLLNLNKVIIQIKGSKSKIIHILILIQRYFKIHKNFFIFTPKINNNNIGFKKIKAIKRKLRKKFIKI
jgi:hypothetical protein